MPPVSMTLSRRPLMRKRPSGLISAISLVVRTFSQTLGASMTSVPFPERCTETPGMGVYQSVASWLFTFLKAMCESVSVMA